MQTILENSVLIADDMRQQYLTETDSLVGKLRPLVQRVKCKGSVADILQNLKGKRIGAIDGGQGRGTLGAVIPFLLRTVTFSVEIGDSSPNREHFSPQYFMVNKLSMGGLAAGEQLLAAIQLLFEIRAAIGSVMDEELDLLLIHGPLIRTLSVFMAETYNVSDKDLETVIGTELFKGFTQWRSNLSGKAASLGGKFPTFLCMLYLLDQLFEKSNSRGTLICGVVERTTSTEFIQRLIFSAFDSIHNQNEAWFERVTGRKVGGTSDRPGYLKDFLDHMGYTDPFILGCLLATAEYTTPQETRANRYQKDNLLIGLPTGFITGYDYLPPLVPPTVASYIRGSEFNSPFKVEMPASYSENTRDLILTSIYAFSQFLPQYSFPVNLDVVDKVAKVPNWLMNALVRMITKEIYERAEPKDQFQYGQLLVDKTRDWQLRPQVRKWLT